MNPREASITSRPDQRVEKQAASHIAGFAFVFRMKTRSLDSQLAQLG